MTSPSKQGQSYNVQKVSGDETSDVDEDEGSTETARESVPRPHPQEFYETPKEEDDEEIEDSPFNVTANQFKLVSKRLPSSDTEGFELSPISMSLDNPDQSPVASVSDVDTPKENQDELAGSSSSGGGIELIGEDGELIILNEDSPLPELDDDEGLKGPYLPEKITKGFKYTLVLDLDETLIHYDEE